MDYATRIIQFPLGIVGLAVSFAILPTLSRLNPGGGGSLGEYRDALVFGIKLVLLLMLPALAIIAALSEPIVAARLRTQRLHTRRHRAHRGHFSVLFAATAAHGRRLPAHQRLLRAPERAHTRPGRRRVRVHLPGGRVTTIGTLGARGLALANAVQNSSHALILLVLLRRSLPGLRLGAALWPFLVRVGADVRAAGAGAVSGVADAEPPGRPIWPVARRRARRRGLRGHPVGRRRRARFAASLRSRCSPLAVPPYTPARMTITRAEVAHVARLARLGLTDPEMDRLASELDHILDAMQELQQLDTSAIPPTAQVIPLQNVMREDVPRPSWPAKTSSKTLRKRATASSWSHPSSSDGVRSPRAAIAELRAPARRRDVSALELARAHLDRIEAPGRRNRARHADRHPRARRGPGARRRRAPRGRRSRPAARHPDDPQGRHDHARHPHDRRLEDPGELPAHRGRHDHAPPGRSRHGPAGQDRTWTSSPWARRPRTPAFFPTRNPWDLDRVPGGSSGGSAAAVGAGFAPFALGTDTGGSIRQPAALCGVVGFKPTYGRVSRYGLIAFASSLDQIGPFTRTVEDCALVMNAIAGHDPCDSTSLQAPVPDYTAALGREPTAGACAWRCRASTSTSRASSRAWLRRVNAAIKHLESLGAELGEVSLPHTKYGVATYYLIAPAECSANLARYDGVKYSLLDSRARRQPVGRVRALARRGLRPRSQAAHHPGHVRAVLGLLRRLLPEGPEGAHADQAGLRPRLRAVRRRGRADVAERRVPLGRQDAGPAGDVPERPVHDSDQPGRPARRQRALRPGRRPAGRPADHRQAAGRSRRAAHRPRVRAGTRLAHAAPPSTACRDAAKRPPRPRPQRPTEYETVIGLECHVQLATRSKMFCGCPTDYAGAAPNTHVCPICLGMPGVLPGHQPHGGRVHVDDRPGHQRDDPGGHQVRPQELPLPGPGQGLPDLPVRPAARSRRLGRDRASTANPPHRLERVHLEEDTGKLSPHVHGAASLVDFNRSGVPLMEIVSEPDLRTPAEARAYLQKLRAILRTLGRQRRGHGEGPAAVRRRTSRCDRSARPKFGTKVEVKNLNSFRSVQRALEYEIVRQAAALDAGERDRPGDARLATRTAA